MLHHLNLPACGNRMNAILAFQRRVLAFACNARTTLPLTQNALRSEFGNQIGDWIRRKTSFCTQLEGLIKHVQSAPGAGARILAAFDHDVVFVDHLNDSNYQFHYHTVLTDADRQAATEVMKSFYGLLSDNGFPSTIHGAGQDTFDRNAWMSAFWTANPELNVCPACDGQRPDCIDGRIRADADHFLPKSHYPFLSVHPQNLVPVCLECNRIVKRDADPIDDQQNEPLLHTFHPYARPAIAETNVLFCRDHAGAPKVRIEDKHGMPSRRVKGLNRVLRLEDRWRGRGKGAQESVIETVRGLARRFRRHHFPRSSQKLRSELQEARDETEKQFGRQPNALIRFSYLEFVLSDANEFSELLTEW